MLGKGRKADLEPNVTYRLARLIPKDRFHWELVWNMHNHISVCPWESKHRPRRRKGEAEWCTGGGGGGGPPLPTLRLGISRSPKGKFQTDSFRLEFSGGHWDAAPNTGRSLADLPLAERCEATRRVAQLVVQSLDYSEWYGVVNDEMSVQVTQDVDGGESRSIFAAGENCDRAMVWHVYVAGKSIAVRIAGGEGEDKTKGRGVFAIQAKAISDGRWEFTWVMGAKYWTCPKLGEDHYVDGCLDPTTETIPTPVLHALIVRQSPTSMSQESSWLEFPPPPAGTEPK
jgi:hypothetical protein